MIDDFVEQHQFLGNAVARIISEHVAGLAIAARDSGSNARGVGKTFR